MNTADRIFKVSWRLFLERGYEATNIRDICKEVGVGLPTLYYHFESKEKLFYGLYDNSWLGYLNNFENRKVFNMDISADLKLFLLFKEDVEYLSNHEEDFKFQLRYMMFPPIELKEELDNKSLYYHGQRKCVIRKVFKQASEENIIKEEHLDTCLTRYEMFIFNQITNRAFYKNLMAGETLESTWETFFKCKIVSLN